MKEHLQKEQEEIGGLGSAKSLEVTPSRTSENALVQNRIFIAFLSDLYGEKENLDPEPQQSYVKNAKQHLRDKNMIHPTQRLPGIPFTQTKFGSYSLMSIGPQILKRLTKRNKVSRKCKNFQISDKTMEWSYL